MTELLTACPFCGGVVNKYMAIPYGGRSTALYLARCSKCSAEITTYPSQSQRIYYWNRRANHD